jgi:hypothetical protein
MFELYADMADPTTGGTWHAGDSTPEVAGEFQILEPFTPRCCDPASWDFLLDGQGDISLRGVPLGLVDLCQPISAPPEATVNEAVLVLDAEFPVPTDATTWGRIKGLYEQSR